MDLKSYIVILKRNIWVILLTLFVTVAVVTVATFLTTPIYTASTTLRVATAASGTVSYSDYMYADRLLNTYIKLATSRPVLDELSQKLNLPIAPSQVAVVVIPNTELITISVDSPDPQVAQNSANSLATILIAQAKQLYAGQGKSTQDILGDQLTQAENDLTQARQQYDIYVSQHPADTQGIAALDQSIQLKEKTYATLLGQYDQARLEETIRANIISVVDPATLPLSPSKPNYPLNYGLGLMGGLVAGIGVAFLFENLGDRLYSSKNIEAIAQLNPIGKVPKMERRNLFTSKKPYSENLRTPFKEAFRRLRIQLLLQNPNNPESIGSKSFLITSSEPGEGKSTITSNLAIEYAHSGKKVIILDCDLHIPNQQKLFGLPNKVGLSTLLNRMTNLQETIQVTPITGLHVLTSGPLSPDPAKLIGTSLMPGLIKRLSQEYDVVFLDSPAVLAVAETTLLASMVDGVILVARRNFIQEEALKESCRQLADCKARMIGIVVNEAEQNGTYYYYGHK
jgi:polysaccharide biosynthesis transport protein